MGEGNGRTADPGRRVWLLPWMGRSACDGHLLELRRRALPWDRLVRLVLRARRPAPRGVGRSGAVGRSSAPPRRPAHRPRASAGHPLGRDPAGAALVAVAGWPDHARHRREARPHGRNRCGRGRPVQHDCGPGSSRRQAGDRADDPAPRRLLRNRGAGAVERLAPRAADALARNQSEGHLDPARSSAGRRFHHARPLTGRACFR